MSGHLDLIANLPESYKDALADVGGTFLASFQPFHRTWKLSGRFLNQQHLTGRLLPYQAGETLPEERLSVQSVQKSVDSYSASKSSSADHL